jgi:hypothetical protein
MERTDQPDPQPSPRAHNPKSCPSRGMLRHPAQAKTGRGLTAYLAAGPLPVQGAGV